MSYFQFQLHIYGIDDDVFESDDRMNKQNNDDFI